jgi:CDP-diacylglycerol pyrophosphatase
VTDDVAGPGRLPRRDLLKLTGVVGAAAVLAGCGDSGSSSPTTVAAGTGTATAAAGAVTASRVTDALCGSDGDTGPRLDLWAKAQVCSAAYQKKQPEPAGCLGTTATTVVLNGAPASNHNYLLVPTRRVKGIECPYIWSAGAPNYWKIAWDQAQPGGAGAVTGTVGLGINSAPDRGQDQLHIHMAQILSGVESQLNTASITGDPSSWATSVVSVVGLQAGHQDPRYYRALRVKNLEQNLFALLRDNVPAAARDMSVQMLVVTARDAGGFYVLNSDPDLTGPVHGIGGTGTCDFLLRYD